MSSLKLVAKDKQLSVCSGSSSERGGGSVLASIAGSTVGVVPCFCCKLCSVDSEKAMLGWS